MLEFEEDPTGLQIFVPVVLSCLDSWSKRLPLIISEAEGNKFSILVDLGDASKFLTYDPYTRFFNVTHNSKESAIGEYAVKLTL